jgi:virulence factor Mce-like protein
VRRLLAIALIVVIAAAFAATSVLGAGASGDSGGRYRVDAIFDTAKGIVPGQLVKIAGARVGIVKDVALTPDYKARLELEVPSRFGPFHADATCAIKPEALIAENFVNCDPGAAPAAVLRERGGSAPTVPVAHTQVPVTPADFFDVWTVPVRERIPVFLAGLGVGTAGRGDDLDALIRRANPALEKTRRVLAVLDRQRRDIDSLLVGSEQTLRPFAARSDRIARFVESAAAVTRRTAAHRDALGATIHRLPTLLVRSRPALRELGQLAQAGTPLVRDLRSAAPALIRSARDFTPFLRAGGPLLTQLDLTARQGRGVVRRALPLTSRLADFSTSARGTAAMLSPLLVSLRDRGAVENLLRLVYLGAAISARYDKLSHLAGGTLTIDQCSPTQSTAGDCDIHYRARRPAAVEPVGVAKQSSPPPGLLDYLLG